jgi:hypothetical protein
MGPFDDDEKDKPPPTLWDHVSFALCMMGIAILGLAALLYLM